MKLKFEKIKPHHLGNYSDDFKNFDITKKENMVSYYDFDEKTIHIETPLPNKKFILKNVFNISNIFYAMIVIHITDTKNIPRRNDHKEYIGEIDINFDELINVTEPSFKITKGEEVYVLVFNDNDIINNNNIIMKVKEHLPKYKFISFEKEKNRTIDSLKDNKRLYSLFEEPKEAGGGVIVSGP